MYYVYVLRKQDEFYIGYTDDLIRRLKEHNREEPGWEPLYYEAYQFEKLARDRERKLKYYGSAWRGLKKRITA